MLLVHAYKIFLMDRSTYCGSRTLEYYNENVNRFLVYLSSVAGSDVSELDCSMIDREAVQSYILHLRQSDIKNTSVNTYFRAVKTFLNYCIDEDYVSSDVLRRIRLLRSDQEPIIPLYQDEVSRIDVLFNQQTESGLRNFCMFHLMLDAGFRSGEVVNLLVSDVFFEKNCVQVKGKGEKYRSVLLAPQLKKAIYRYLAEYRPFVLVPGNEYFSQPVFVKLGSSDFINSNVIKQLFARIKKKAGISRLHPHLLRHTFATSYILGGGNLEFLRLMLGHSDYETTKLYLHLAQQMQMLGSDIYKLDPIFFKTVY